MECTTNPRTAYDKNTLCKLIRNFQVPNPLPFRILLTFRSNLQIERNKVSALPHWCGCSRNAWQPFLFKRITKVSLSVTLPWWNASPNPRNANLQLFCKLMKKIPKLLVLYLSKTSWHFRSNLKTEKEKSVCHCALWMLQQKWRRFCSSRSWTLSLSLSLILPRGMFPCCIPLWSCNACTSEIVTILPLHKHGLTPHSMIQNSHKKFSI